MPQALSPIPLETQIVERDGTITPTFRLRWEELRNGFQQAPTKAVVALEGQTAAVATQAAYTTTVAGLYRISWYARKTVADGVSSSLTVTLGWAESGVALTESGAALVADAISAQQSGSKVVYADALTDLAFAVAYASNTPNRMTYRITVLVEQMA